MSTFMNLSLSSHSDFVNKVTQISLNLQFLSETHPHVSEEDRSREEVKLEPQNLENGNDTYK